MRITKQLIVILGAVLLVFVLGFLDYETGYELSFFVFYTFPLALMAWYLGYWGSIAATIFCFITWMIADFTSGHTYTEKWIFYWNAFVRLIFFMMISLMVAMIKRQFDIERSYARIDGLTGLYNGRIFREKFEEGQQLARRLETPYAVAFIDLDNFKKANDTMGHAKGDEILQRVCKTITKNLRTTDIVGRMGGDEFSIFFPGTDMKGVEQVLKDLHKKLMDLVGEESWPIGFSIGVVSINANEVSTVDKTEAIRLADKLMYKIKQSGKNNFLVQSLEEARTLPEKQYS